MSDLFVMSMFDSFSRSSPEFLMWAGLIVPRSGVRILVTSLAIL